MDRTAPVADASNGAFAACMEHVPAAFAVTQGPAHTIVCANAAFRRVASGISEAVLGTPIANAFRDVDARDLVAVLDEARQLALAVRDRPFPSHDGTSAWKCTAWPSGEGDIPPDHILIELRPATDIEGAHAFQRQLAERMLMSALRDQETADVADASRARAMFLAVGGGRLAESLDEETTLHTIAGLALPQLGAWCIVDMLDENDAMRRVAIIHPDPTKQALLRDVAARWSPGTADPFGIPMAMRSGGPTVVSEAPDAALAATVRDPETLRVLHDAGVGPLLTVPLIVRDRLIGAITFVAGARDHEYKREDVELAQDLATRSAMALDSARLHGEAITLRAQAESASEAKTAFLAMMGHELRTPLNAIGGYVDLIDMGIRGPVTAAQRADLGRIRRSQRHLTALVTDILNLVRVGSAGLLYVTSDVVVLEELTAAIELVEPLVDEKGLLLDEIACDPAIVGRADREKLAQVLVNLLSNAIKFTPRGGRIRVDCSVDEDEDVVLMRVRDEGVGIAPELQSVIFDPFVQGKAGLAGRNTGVGLGLAISHNLARGMGGDLTVVSAPGEGTTFTLRLPRAEPPVSPASSRES